MFAFIKSTANVIYLWCHAGWNKGLFIVLLYLKGPFKISSPLSIEQPV